MLIKVQSKKIHEGYNPNGYTPNKGEGLSTLDSFVFSFKNDQDIYDMKTGR